MIVKSLTRKSNVKQLLNYLFAKEEKISAVPLVLRHNIRTRSVEKWAEEFAINETFRLNKRSNNIKAYHTILSFSSRDKSLITPQTLKAIAKEYIRLRGTDSLYIGTAHFDKEHVHLHMVMSGTKYLTGESNRMSQTAFRALKISLDKYQQLHFPALSQSLPEHGKQLIDQVPPWMSQRSSQKITVQQSVAKTYLEAFSLPTFIESLIHQGYEPYYRNTKLTGIKTVDGTKFRFKTLGYSSEKLEELNNRERLHNSLIELQAIRERSNKLSREKGHGIERDLQHTKER